MHYSLKRATLWNIAGYLYLILASFISTPILISYLGLTSFTQYGLIISTLALVSTLNLGLPLAVTRALSTDLAFSTRRQTIWATSSVLFIATGILAGLVATLTSYLLRIDLVILPIIFGIGLMTNLVGHYQTLPHAEGHFGYYNAKTFIVGTANTLLAAYLASIDYSLITILAVQLVSYLFTLFVLVYFSLKFFPNPAAGIASYQEAKQLISFGIKNQLGTLIGQLQAQYAKYLLAFVSPLQFSAYYIAVGLMQKIAGGVTQIATALYPTSSRHKADPSIRVIYYKLQTILVFFGIAIIILEAMFSKTFLLWWLQDPSLASTTGSVLHTFVYALAMLILTPLASTILDSHGHPEITSIFAALTTFIEISLALLLYQKYGLFAPVYASLIALLLTTPPLLYITNKIMLKSSL